MTKGSALLLWLAYMSHECSTYTYLKSILMLPVLSGGRVTVPLCTNVFLLFSFFLMLIKNYNVSNQKTEEKSLRVSNCTGNTVGLWENRDLSLSLSILGLLLHNFRSTKSGFEKARQIFSYHSFGVGINYSSTFSCRA